MTNFKKGDVLVGKDRSFNGSRHPIVYIQGPAEAPLAIIVTHDSSFPCNVPFNKLYQEKRSYFVAHPIQKMSEWGPYKKTAEVSEEDLKLIESRIANMYSMTWDEYKKHKENGCPDHNL